MYNGIPYDSISLPRIILRGEVLHCQSSSKSADTDDDDDDDDEQTTIGDLDTPAGTAATRIVQVMATYRKQFKGSGNGKSDKTMEAYLTGAAWYLSSAMLILEEQHGKDSDLYTAAKAEHDMAVRLRKDFSRNITQALREGMQAARNPTYQSRTWKAQKQRQHHDVHLYPNVLRPMEEK